jgi:hypothetical protein
VAEIAKAPRPSPKRPREPRLDSAIRIRRELVRIFWDCRRGRLDSADGTRLANMLNVALTAMRDDVTEQRIQALERRA